MDDGCQPKLPARLWDLPFLDRGISGIVFAIDEFSVIKTPTGGEANARDFEVERRIFKRLGEHPRIVKMLYIYKDMLVLERLLYPLRVRTLEIRDKRLTPSTEEILKWSAQTAEGMQHLHENKILQVDIGLHNLLLDWDDNVKYCDFSGSSIDGEIPTAAVSPHALHPHARVGSPTVQSELFSLGSALYEISTTYKAYEGMDESQLQDRYAKGEYPTTDRLLLGPVILKCWRGNYKNAGEAAAEIRAIQREILLGDLKSSLRDIIARRKEYQDVVHTTVPDFSARVSYLPPLLLITACLIAHRSLRSTVTAIINRLGRGLGWGI